MKPLTVEDIKSLQRNCKHYEQNHRIGDKDFMELLIEGSEMLLREFGGTDIYKLDLLWCSHESK